MASGLGMKVLAWNRTPKAHPGVEFVSIERLLAESDAVSMHLLLNDETRGFLSRERIAAMRRGALLVNTARGALVDEAAMIEALASGQLGHAALDVFEIEPLPAGHVLTTLANVTLSAHSGFRTPEANQRLIEAAFAHCRRIVGGPRRGPRSRRYFRQIKNEAGRQSCRSLGCEGSAAPAWPSCRGADVDRRGGGGGGSDSGIGVRLSNVQAQGTTQRVYASTTPIGIVWITADVSGDLSRLNGRTIYVIVTDPDGLFEATPAVTIMPNGIGNSIRLFGKSTVGRTGTYRGPLTLRVCLDIACNQQFDGSPVQLPLQIDVLPGLQVASPLVVDLAFGQAPTTIEVPVTVPVDAAGFSAALTPLPGKNNGAIFYEHLNAPMPGLRITPRRLPVGAYTQTFTLSGTAFVGPVPYLLQTALPVTINVRPTPGLEFAIDPPQLALQTLSTGSFIPEAYVPEVTVLAADGLRYSDVSRVQYLPAGPGRRPRCRRHRLAPGRGRPGRPRLGQPLLRPRRRLRDGAHDPLPRPGAIRCQRVFPGPRRGGVAGAAAGDGRRPLSCGPDRRIAHLEIVVLKAG